MHKHTKGLADVIRRNWCYNYYVARMRLLLLLVVMV
jgi:hypothetical protein